MTDETPVVVFRGPDVDARLIWSQLRGHGIEAFVLNDMGSSAPYAFGVGNVVQVAVRPEDVDAARDVLVASGHRPGE